MRQGALLALVGVVAAGGAPFSGALTGLLLGTRNTLYGLRLAPLLAWTGWRRAAAAQILIDESTAMSVTREKQIIEKEKAKVKSRKRKRKRCQ